MMENQEVDVVIVGSGVAGCVMAKILTNAGKKVLLLEAGLEAGIALDAEGAYKTYVEGYLKTFYETAAKATNGPYPNITDAKSPDVLDIKAKTPYADSGYFVQMGPLPFASDCLRGPGGTTLHWLGNTPRMLPNDFEMLTRYGVGKNWPIKYDELMPYYEMAENEIGIAGDVSAQKGPDMEPNRNYGADYTFPMKKIPQSYMDQRWMEKSEGLKVKVHQCEYTITYIPMPQGRNSVPNPEYRFAGLRWDTERKRLYLEPMSGAKNYEPVGAIWDQNTGQRCEGNASCVPICPVQAKYNALKSLKRSNRKNLQIRTQAVASSIMVDPKSGDVTGIVYKTYKKGDSKQYQTAVATGKIYVLAASAIENAKILLASAVGNRSGQVGRNLMDHCVMLTWGLMPEKVYAYRGPGCTTNIPTFRDGTFRKDFAAWISPLDNWGWSWPTGSPGSDLLTAVETNGMFGKRLRDYISDRVARQILLHFECEQLPDPDNRVTIDPAFKDQLDNYRPVIHYNVSEYMLKSFEAAKQVSDQIFGANGIEDYTRYDDTEPDYVVYKGKGYTFRGAGHIVGTHCMGSDGENSVVDANQRAWDHKNLYVVGCGSMTTLGTSNPTLTMTALTIKSAEAILQQLEN